MDTAHDAEPEKKFYNRQNRLIHKARAQLCMSLDDCRELARQIGGAPSLSSLSLKDRWILIEELKLKGARISNPRLPGDHISHFTNKSGPQPKDVYPQFLADWQRRFPGSRPGFASNKQLAWIQALWELDFNDGRAGSSARGLRGFIYRQTQGLHDGPVSDLAFLRSDQVSAVITPLLARAEKRKGRKT